MQVWTNKVPLIIVPMACQTAIGLENVHPYLVVYPTDHRGGAGFGSDATHVGDQLPALFFREDVLKRGHGGKEGGFQTALAQTPVEVVITQPVYQCLVGQVNGAGVHTTTKYPLSIPLWTVANSAVLRKEHLFTHADVLF